MSIRRGVSALEAVKLAVPPSGVFNTRGVLARKPRVDPAILTHRNPRAWEELLGWGRVETFAPAAGQAAPLQPRNTFAGVKCWT